MASPVYRFYTADLLTGNVLGEPDLINCRAAMMLNDPGDFDAAFPLGRSTTLDTLNLATTQPGRTAIYIERNSELIWGGIIWSRTYDSESQLVDISAQTFDSYWSRVVLEKNFVQTNTEQVTILNNMLNRVKAQAGSDIGVNLNVTLPTGITRSIALPAYEFHYASEVLDFLTDQQDGAEYTIQMRYNNPNMITTNPSFESATVLTGWTTTGSGTTGTAQTGFAHDGAQSLQEVGTTGGADTYISQTVACSASTTYTLSAWRYLPSAITAGAIGNRSLWFADNGGNSNGSFTLTTSTPTGSWIQDTLTFTTAVGASTVNVRLYIPQGTVYWDDVTLTNVTAQDHPNKEIKIAAQGLLNAGYTLTLDYPGTIKKYNWPENGFQGGNKFAGRGGGSGNLAPTAVLTDAVSIAAGYPSLWSVYNFPDVADRKLLRSKVRRARGLDRVPIATPTFDVTGDAMAGFYQRIGCNLNLNILDDRFSAGYAATRRMYGWEMQLLDDENEETVTLITDNGGTTP